MGVLHYLMLRDTSAVVITCDGSKSPPLIHLLRMAYMLLDRLSLIALGPNHHILEFFALSHALPLDDRMRGHSRSIA